MHSKYQFQYTTQAFGTFHHNNLHKHPFFPLAGASIRALFHSIRRTDVMCSARAIFYNILFFLPLCRFLFYFLTGVFSFFKHSSNSNTIHLCFSFSDKNRALNPKGPKPCIQNHKKLFVRFCGYTVSKGLPAKPQFLHDLRGFHY